ncbi:MAG: TetR/AcrR family transcriptional regulator [Catenulispora sp.]|nr:TetR/AcrR family transcriptional regulator [Catenulispora sp.]NUR57269.1 TetR/AcrR family transcriptional regulator [Catenulispora sp.]
MTEEVKRRYHAPQRAEQATARRASLVDAAAKLFAEHGYAATTMPAIADRAGVSLRTAHAAFGTKSRLLRAVWDRALKGDLGEEPMADRPWYLEVLEQPDPHRQLELVARHSRIVKERIGPILKVIRGGAETEPDLAELWELIQSDFRTNQKAIVESLAAKGALRDSLDVERGADILWTLNNPDVWLLLVDRRGWSPAQWEAWFLDAAGNQLIG